MICATSELKQTSILVVDDYAMVVRIIRHHLKRIGYENVDQASNGAEALERLAGKQYGLIISDWHMEPITGFQLLQRVRADPVHADVPFIMATVEARAQYMVAARNAGANDYILKPFNAATLRASIETAFAQHADGAHFEGKLAAARRSAARRIGGVSQH